MSLYFSGGGPETVYIFVISTERSYYGWSNETQKRLVPESMSSSHTRREGLLVYFALQEGIWLPIVSSLHLWI